MKTGWIIEYNGNSGNFYEKGNAPRWRRSGNCTVTIEGVPGHSSYVFLSREAARKEIKAQADKFTYRTRKATEKDLGE